MSLEEIKEQALKLSPDEREVLAQVLWDSVDDEPIDPEFKAMLERRWDEIVTGKVKTVSHDEVMAEMTRAINEVRENRVSSGSEK
jgi:putative addiction module component (TIGR02574 family)